MMKKLCILIATGVMGMTGAAYAASFAEIDANGDGAISADEFAAAYPEVGQDAWTAADTNGDGMLTEDEHVAAVEAGTLPQ
jgi:Ca2+-binding EF-hand superfamily protein